MKEIWEEDKGWRRLDRRGEKEEEVDLLSLQAQRRGMQHRNFLEIVLFMSVT